MSENEVFGPFFEEDEKGLFVYFYKDAAKTLLHDTFFISNIEGDLYLKYLLNKGYVVSRHKNIEPYIMDVNEENETMLSDLDPLNGH